MIQVSIIGIGLIGGSIALCLKKAYGEKIYIKGYDMNPTQLQLASSLGVIDEENKDIESTITDSDFIFLCTPVQTLGQLLSDIMVSSFIKSGAIITDVGSTKEEIVTISQRLTSHSQGVFIGGHPMAGSHKSGVEAANERLFENAYYVLTPQPGEDPEMVHKLSELLAATKAKIVTMSPEEHDQVVGAISHFPHLMASALVEYVNHYNEQNEWYLRLAAGGFKDITRIASSNPRMWRDITLSNKKHLIEQMKDWQAKMDQVMTLLEEGTADQIEDFFAEAKKIRDGIMDRKRGAIPAFYDLYVDVPDHPGVIGHITTMLGEHKISITNIEILETREDIMGALRLSFRHEDDLEKAMQVIRQANYNVYKRE